MCINLVTKNDYRRSCSAARNDRVAQKAVRNYEEMDACTSILALNIVEISAAAAIKPPVDYLAGSQVS